MHAIFHVTIKHKNNNKDWENSMINQKHLYFIITKV